MTRTIDIKRGDSFEIVFDRVDDNGAPIDLTGATIASTIVRPDATVVQPLTVTLLDQIATPGRIRVSATKEETANWPLANLMFDIEHTNGTYRRSSVDIIVRVGRDRTVVP